MNNITFTGDDDTLRYSKDAGIFIRSIDVEIGLLRRRIRRGKVAATNPSVIFCIGQSNAANHGTGKYRPRHPVFCFNPLDTRFYLAEDPIPGASGEGAGPWGRLGDLVIGQGMVRSLLFVNIAFGGSYITDWVPGGQYFRRLVFAIERVHRARLRIDRILWWQGEAEANNTEMPAPMYRKHFLAMLAEMRSRGVQAPIWVAQSTLCAIEGRPFDNRGEIRRAQADLPDSKLGIFAGPDTDQIGTEGRSDECHFNEIGLQRAAELWLEVLPAFEQRTVPSTYNSLMDAYTERIKKALWKF